MLRSELGGLWLFAAVVASPFVVAGLLVAPDEGIGAGIGAAAVGALFGWLVHRSINRVYGRNVVLATDEGLVDSRRGRTRTAVPWEDVDSVTVDGGNFWNLTGGSRSWALTQLYVHLGRPVRSTDAEYPTLRVGACLIVRHRARLVVMVQAEDVLAQSMPSTGDASVGSEPSPSTTPVDEGDCS